MINSFNKNLLRLLSKRVLLHSIFWLVLISTFSIGFFFKKNTINYLLWNFVGVIISYLFLVYISLYLFEFLVYRKKKLILYLLLLVITIFLISYANAYIYNHTNPGNKISTSNFIPFISFLSFFSLSLKISKSLFLQLQKEIDEKTSLILQKDYFLRSQIHPHFLFNTLNNLYGLSILKSEKLPDLMLLLSDVLRYQIKTVNTPLVFLEEEIIYINKYIELEKIRYGSELQFHFNYAENIDKEIKIAPGILVIFIENAFTHTKSSKDNHYYIEMKLSTKSNFIIFSIKNSFSKFESESTNTGIKNVTSRLKLIYHNEYLLDINKLNDLFTVNLKVPIRK